MRKWWWWWVPGCHKKWKLEKRRVEALSSIVGERLFVEVMVQRPRAPNDTLDAALLDKVLQQLTDIHAKAERAIHKDDLDDSVDDAELQGVFAGYLCPATEIQDEGLSVIDQIEGWGIPKTAIKKLRDGPAKKLAASNPMEARSALYALFGERVAWDDYIDEYEERMRLYTHFSAPSSFSQSPPSLRCIMRSGFRLFSCSGCYLQAQPEAASVLCRRCQP